MVNTERETAAESTVLIWHTADWHFCGAQYGSTSRGSDFYSSVYNTLEREFKSGNIPDLIVNGGDIFDNPRPTSGMHEQMTAVDQLLKTYGVPMLTITGNHDLATPTWMHSLFKHNADTGIICMDDRKKRYCGLDFVGMAYVSRQEFLKTGVPDTGDILIMHAPVQEFVSFPSEKNYTLADLPTGSFHAILLGDIHQPGYMTDKGCLVGYPGSTEMCDKNEPVEKTFTVLEVDNVTKDIRQLDPIVVATRDFFTGEIRTESELADAIAVISKMKDPVVIFDYDRDVPGILPKMHAAPADPTTALLRYCALPRINEVTLVSARQENLNPEDFLNAVIGEDRPSYMYNTCRDFIRQNPDAYLNLDVAVNARLQELQSK